FVDALAGHVQERRNKTSRQKVAMFLHQSRHFVKLIPKLRNFGLLTLWQLCYKWKLSHKLSHGGTLPNPCRTARIIFHGSVAFDRRNLQKAKCVFGLEPSR